MRYFISGHRNITMEEFKTWYIPSINEALEDDEDHIFVMGDCEGADRMAQDYLSEKLRENELSRIIVYHIGQSPRYVSRPGIQTKGGYKDDIDRDSAMTWYSDIDIAFIRKGEWTSGTAQNILRRKERL